MDELNSIFNIDVDDVFVKFKVLGRYHAWCLFLLVLVNISTAFGAVNYIFVAESVTYRCSDHENSTWGTFNSSHVCSEWIYDNPYSLVAEFQLACQEWKRTLVGSVHNIGYMIGLIAIGPISDRIGRKNSIIFATFINGLLGVAKSFATGYWAYLFLELLEAIAGTNFSPIYMLAVELVATKKRVTYMTICNNGWYIGYTLYALIASQFLYWRHLLRILYLPNLLILLYFFLLDESPRWLLSKGKKKEAIRIIKKAAKLSDVNLDYTILEKVTFNDRREMKLFQLLKKTLASKTLLKRLFVCIIWWTTASFVNYGLMINSVSLQGDKYWNFAIISMIDIPGTVLNMLSLKVFKRKYSLILSFLLGGVFCFVQPFIPLHVPWLSITLYMFGKFMSSFYFDTIYLYTSELFPTYTRNSMHALCSSLGRIGSIIAPQTPLLMRYWTGLPSVTFGSAALFAGALTFLVPDTSHDSLPDNVVQAEAVGVKLNLCNNVEN